MNPSVKLVYLSLIPIELYSVLISIHGFFFRSTYLYNESLAASSCVRAISVSDLTYIRVCLAKSRWLSVFVICIFDLVFTTAVLISAVNDRVVLRARWSSGVVRAGVLLSIRNRISALFDGTIDVILFCLGISDDASLIFLAMRLFMVPFPTVFLVRFFFG